MEILNKTYFRGSTYTLSHLYIDGMFMCDILEDVVRELPATCPNTPKGLECRCPEKIKGQTAIPAGRYECDFSYSPRFKRNLLEIKNVPHFIGIRLHAGNKDADTEGCLLPGENKVKGQVINSRAWETKLNSMFEEAKKKGEKIFITIER